MPRKRPQVLGVDLKRSESGRQPLSSRYRLARLTGRPRPRRKGAAQRRLACASISRRAPLALGAHWASPQWRCDWSRPTA